MFTVFAIVEIFRPQLGDELSQERVVGRNVVRFLLGGSSEFHHHIIGLAPGSRLAFATIFGKGSTGFGAVFVILFSFYLPFPPKTLVDGVVGVFDTPVDNDLHTSSTFVHFVAAIVRNSTGHCRLLLCFRCWFRIIRFIVVRIVIVDLRILFLPLALSVLFFFLLLFLVFHKFFSRWQLESKAGRFFRFAFFLLRRFGWEKFLNARLFQLHCRAFVLFALFWRRRLWFFGFFWLFDCLFLALHLWPRLPRGLRLVVVHDLPSTALTENHRADARGSHVCRGSRRRPADHHLVFFSSIAFVGRVLDKHLSWLTHKGRHVIRLSLFHPHIIANSDSVNAGVGRFHLLYSNRLLCRIARTFVLFSLAPFKILCGVY
mmetsp:Transcript_5294/g.12595  ORF Transcript_5294/g.12595 Transcript_5294/m.12595 type:complete len:373 (-) Transcript_5294:3-1121(-)